MKTNHTNSRPNRHLLALGFLLGALPLGSARGAVSVINTVTFNAGTNLYEYSYSIQNTGLLDLILISVPTSIASNVTGIASPTGFTLTFDPSQGQLNFNEDNDIFTDQTFAPSTTVSPFSFSSPLAPGSTTFTAFDVEGTEFTGTTTSPVPEPSASLLSGIAIASLMARRRRHPSH